MPTNAFAQLVADLSPRYGAGEARSIARLVFEDAFGTRRPEEKVFSEAEEKRFLDIRQRLLLGEPVQYVLGEADFFGLKFMVNPSVLIPRQETEELVAWVLDFLKKTSLPPNPAVLDAGLGSGCIGLTLKAKRPGIQLFGLENSPAALAVASENARRLLPGQQVHFQEGDMLDADDWESLPALDVVVSNPPYIPTTERHLMPAHVLKHEPEAALFVPEPNDALLFYRALADFSKVKLRPGGALFVECNEFNAPMVAAVFREKGFDEVELRRDLSGADRMVRGVLTGSTGFTG